MSTDSVTGKHPANRGEDEAVEENEPKRPRLAEPGRVQLDLDTDDNSGSDSDRTSDFSESDSEPEERGSPEWLVKVAHQLIYVNGLESTDPLVDVTDLKQQLICSITSNTCAKLEFDHFKRDFAQVIETVSTMITALFGVVSHGTLVETVVSTLSGRFRDLNRLGVPLDKKDKPAQLPPSHPVSPLVSLGAPSQEKPTPKKPATSGTYKNTPTTWDELCKQATTRCGGRLCATSAAVLAIFGHGGPGMQINADHLRQLIDAARCTKLRRDGVQEASDPKKSVLSAVFTDRGQKRVMRTVSLRKDILDALKLDPSLGRRFLEACQGSKDFKALSPNFDGEYIVAL